MSGRLAPFLKIFVRGGVVVNDEQSVLAAIDLKEKYKLSFLDVLTLEAARRSVSTILYSEDFSNGQQVGS